MMSFLGKKGVSPLMCLLLGVAYAATFIIPQLFLLTYAVLTAFFCIIFSGSRIKRLFRHSFMFLLGTYTTLYSFLSQLYPFEGFNFTHTQAVLITLGACILIPFLHALIHSVVLLPLKLLSHRPLLLVFTFPCMWAVADFVLEYGSLAFPWAKVALTQTSFLPFLQTESLFGPYFITLIIFTFATLTAYAIINKDASKAIIASALVIANLLVGMVIYLIPTEYTSSVKASALQGDVRADEKWQQGSLEIIIEKCQSLIDEAVADGSELIILPESSIPADFTENGTVGRFLSDNATKYNVTLVCGVLRTDESGEYNSAVAALPDGSFTHFYDKRHLVPFGEFIPLRETLEALIPALGEMNLSGMCLSQGEDPVVFDTPAGGVGTLICFDSIFQSLALDEVRAGAEIMTVVTNDSWFKASHGTYQHARMAQTRAIETGRYLIQAGNTGISAIIDDKGRVITASGPMTTACETAEVRLTSSRTLYSIIGDAVLILAFAFASAVILLCIGEKIYDHKKRKAL